MGGNPVYLLFHLRDAALHFESNESWIYRALRTPRKRSLFCPARRLRVAVRLVRISSAIYKERFRNCCAGLHIHLDGGKTRKKMEKSLGWRQAKGGGGGSLAENDATWDESSSELRRIVHRSSNTVHLCDSKSNTNIQLIKLIFKTSRLILNIVGLSKSLCRCFLTAICQWVKSEENSNNAQDTTFRLVHS